MNWKKLPWVWIICAISPAGAASVIPAERAVEMLRERPDTPIIDARSIVARSMAPIRGSLAVDDHFALADGAVALLVGNNEQQGLAAATQVEANHPGAQVFVVEGGDAGLRKLIGGVSVHTGTGLPSNFIIPSDTCQTGPALHVFGEDANRP